MKGWKLDQTRCCTCTILVYCRCLMRCCTVQTEWCFSCLLVKSQLYWQLLNEKRKKRPSHVPFRQESCTCLHLLILTIVCMTSVKHIDFTSLYDIMFIYFFFCLVSLGSCTRQLRNWLLVVTSTSCCQRTAAGKEPRSSQPWAAAWDKSWTINRKYISSVSLLSPHFSGFPLYCWSLLFCRPLSHPVSVSRSSSCFSLSTWERGDSFLCCVRSQRAMHYVVVRLCLISHCTNTHTPEVLAFFLFLRLN